MRVDSRGWKHYDVEFTNKDPRIIMLFLRFLREVIKVEEQRVKLQLFSYPDLNDDELMDYWSEITNIP